MIVTNNTPYTIVAFGWHAPKGFGPDVEIEPGQSAEVNGPYLGEMDGGACYVALSGEVICHEGPDDGNAYQISHGNPIYLSEDIQGVTIHIYGDSYRVIDV